MLVEVVLLTDGGGLGQLELREESRVLHASVVGISEDGSRLLRSRILPWFQKGQRHRCHLRRNQRMCHLLHYLVHRHGYRQGHLGYHLASFAA